jgi:serine/threonine-protein kinase
MEYVEGAQLKGPLPLDEALRYAAQICAALDHAHNKGITHRDLKPANIMVTKAGIKLLDFGLAKLKSVGTGQAPATDPENTPTLSMALTGRNEIVGTLYYMSPEQLQAQATGKEIDGRSDIFSFGLVLYEMLTGKRAFEGASPASVIAAILERPAPSIADVAPAALDRVLKICLAKDPDERWQTARDLKRELEWIASASSDALLSRDSDGAGAGAEDSAPILSRLGRITGIAAAVLAIGLIGVSWIAYRATRPIDRPLMRFTDDLDAEVSLGFGEGPAIAISPDGTRLAFVSRGSDGKTALSQRLLESPKSTALAGTEGAGAPFFSPDSRWIAFFADQKLKKISVEGGAAVALCDVGANVRGGFWGEDGNILFSNQRTPLMRVPSSGGTPRPATELDKQKGEVTNRFAQLLPGGEAFLFTASKDNNIWEDATIQVQTIKTGKRKTLVEGGYFGRYMPGGYLIYVHGGTLFAAPMDLKRLELTGPASPVLDDMSGYATNGFAQLDFTPSGTFVYVKGTAAVFQYSLFWLDATGNTQILPAPNGDYRSVRASPDGTRIAVRVNDGSGVNLSVYEWAQNRMTRLTFLKTSVNTVPAWTPDSKHLVFTITSQELSGPGIYWMRADGAGEPQRLLAGTNFETYSFSPDGKRLAYALAGTDSAIWTLPLDLADPEHPKAGKPELFLQSKSILRVPAFSPDGRWIAYAANESGRFEVFVRPFPGPGGKWQISTAGGFNPIWSRTGKELFYTSNNGGIGVASYTVNGDSFAASQPRVWSEKAPPLPANPDLMPDGKHFVVLLPPSSANTTERQTHVTFLLNFSDELRRKVPAGK